MPTSSQRSRYAILSIAPTSFFYDYGCHVRILEETLILQELGHQVTICTYHSGRPVAGLDIVRTPDIPWRQGAEVGSSRHKAGFDLLLGVKVLQQALRRRPDVIHAHLHEGALIGALVGRLLRIPVVFDFQGSLTGEMVDHHFLNPRGRFFTLMQRLERMIDHAPDVIVTSSQSAVEGLTNHFACPPAKVRSIPDCVNCDVFAPGVGNGERAALREKLGIPSWRKVVVYLGLLAEHQGTGLLLAAAAQVQRVQPDTHFLIMGFPNVEGYARQAREMGLGNHTSFPGRIPYEQAPLYLSLGDVAVSPKTSATEGAGKLLNYMALGLPVVSFDTPVAREYLGESGVYAPLGDENALAAALLDLLRADVRRTQLGRDLRARALRHYSWRQAGAQLVSIYDSVVGRQARGS